MVTRHSSSGWTTHVLAFVEWLGRVLGLALAALMLPVVLGAFWLGRLPQRLLSALRRREHPPPAILARPRTRATRPPPRNRRRLSRPAAHPAWGH